MKTKYLIIIFLTPLLVVCLRAGDDPKYIETETETYQSPSYSKGRPDDIESTFVSLGADMEEFFTGHRTIDQ